MSIQSSFPVLTRRMLKAVRTGLAQQIRDERSALRHVSHPQMLPAAIAAKRAQRRAVQTAMCAALSHNARMAHLCETFASGKPYAAAELRAEPLTVNEASYLALHMERTLGFVRAGYYPIDQNVIIAWLQTPASAEMLERQQRAREAHFQARLARQAGRHPIAEATQKPAAARAVVREQPLLTRVRETVAFVVDQVREAVASS